MHALGLDQEHGQKLLLEERADWTVFGKEMETEGERPTAEKLPFHMIIHENKNDLIS